jgi:tetratricopeptide (TPR) repeat protein
MTPSEPSKHELVPSEDPAPGKPVDEAALQAIQFKSANIMRAATPDLDIDDKYLKAEPISRKRMDLLWLDPPHLSQLAKPIAEHGKVIVELGDSSNQREHEYTQEDYDWAKQIEAIVDVAHKNGQDGNHELSIFGYQKALESAPGCDLFLMSIGSSYAHLGQLGKAERYLERAAQISPGNARIKENLTQVRAEIAQQVTVKPWGAVKASLFAFATGSLVRYLITNFLILRLSVADQVSDTLLKFMAYANNFVSWGLVGLLLGGILTRWKRYWIWAGVFGAAGLIHTLYRDLITTPSVTLLQTALFYWLPLGLLMGIAFGLMARGLPDFKLTDPLPRLLIGGGVTFFIAGLALNWSVDLTRAITSPQGFTSPAFLPWLVWIRLFWQVVVGLLEGLGLGLALDWPRLQRKL